MKKLYIPEVHFTCFERGIIRGLVQSEIWRRERWLRAISPEVDGYEEVEQNTEALRHLEAKFVAWEARLREMIQ